MDKLGPRQLSVLNRLRKEGVWYPGCGWVWDSARKTQDVLETLVRLGHVKKVVETRYVPA